MEKFIKCFLLFAPSVSRQHLEYLDPHKWWLAFKKSNWMNHLRLRCFLLIKLSRFNQLKLFELSISLINLKIWFFQKLSLETPP